MNRSAHVESIDAVQALRVALSRFQEDASDALVAIEQEIHRFLDWLEHDQLKYWIHQTNRASEQVGEARSNLERKRVMTVGGETPPCREEKKALELAKRRHRFAEEKVAEVRRMRREVDHEVNEVKGRLSSLADSLTSDVPKASTVLEHVLTSLHRYAEMGRETSGTSTRQGTDTQSRSAEDSSDAENSDNANEPPPTVSQEGATDASM